MPNDIFKNFHPDDLIKLESCFEDLVLKKLDLSWFANRKDKKYYKMNSEKHVDVNDKSVEYNLNEDYFRSDNFKKEHDGLHILFSGCSESEGVGANIEYAWTHILYKKISENIECSGFFNLSRSGWGWSKIVTNALIYFQKYGYPDAYFILLPNHQRSHKFFKEGIKNDDGVIYGNWQYQQEYLVKDYEAAVKDYSIFRNEREEKEYKENFIKFLTSWNLFVYICKINNVKLIFSTWDEIDAENLNNLNLFDTFIDMNIRKNLDTEYMLNYYNKYPKTKYDIRKRDGHSGYLEHHFWADQFYKKYKEVFNND